MKATAYFEHRVKRDRPEACREDWIERAIRAPVAFERQPDGRLRHWIEASDDDGVVRMLRVVLLEDGETVHNAFFDRGFSRR